ncbi:uncharacterized protein At4g14100-like [Punica granatum]|uniref:Uncharacterized protein At4g14100-like n=1 Tax=Punica granatum TaxID=22663 RepID=A0A6P8E5N8_PUNGR|nr:uncharacterized protein At4g14100-like [Punica granatum]
MASPQLRRVPVFLTLMFFYITFAPSTSWLVDAGEDPVPAVWPEQFHALMFMNSSGNLSLIDLWYDWPNGRNFNIIRDQLSTSLYYDLEWNNGTSFFYRLDPASEQCRSVQLEVGILRPNWLDGATYLGQRRANGFLCNVWEKVDFIWYYEDVATKRPVQWVFYTGREANVMTYEVGAVLEDAKWQAPSYCFSKKEAINGQNPELAITGRFWEESTRRSAERFFLCCGIALFNLSVEAL